MNRSILVTGGAGYLGSILTRQLLNDGHEVTVYDRALFGTSALDEVKSNDDFELVEGDVRDTEKLAPYVERADDVVHMAALVGEPACSEDPDETIEVNLQATVDLKDLCKQHDVDDFVFLSTCSVYGDDDEDYLTETSKVRPISSYSQTKRLSEESLLKEESDSFHPTVLRLATVYGLSPRPRFDLSVNYLTKEAVLRGEGTIYGGDQWRPFVHTTDVARAIRAVLDADSEITGNQIFNVGGDDENYQMKEVGKMLDKAVPSAKIDVDPSMVDDRSYRCSFEKIREMVGFEPEMTVADGIEEVRAAVESGTVDDPDNDKHYNYTPKEQ